MRKATRKQIVTSKLIDTNCVLICVLHIKAKPNIQRSLKWNFSYFTIPADVWSVSLCKHFSCNWPSYYGGVICCWCVYAWAHTMWKKFHWLLYVLLVKWAFSHRMQLIADFNFSWLWGANLMNSHLFNLPYRLKIVWLESSLFLSLFHSHHFSYWS